MKKVFCIILSVLMLMSICLGVSATDVESCEHKTKKIIITEKPICAAGKAEIRCDDCDKLIEDEVLTAVHFDADRDNTCDLCGAVADKFIRYTVSDPYPAVGDDFTVTVSVSGLDGVLASGSAPILYDSSLASWKSVTPASYTNTDTVFCSEDRPPVYNGDFKWAANSFYYTGEAGTITFGNLYSETFTAVRSGRFIPYAYHQNLADFDDKQLDYVIFTEPADIGGPNPAVLYSGAEAILAGDLNGDGNIRANDARTCLRVSAELETLPLAIMPIADINHDGKIRANDARIILRISAELESVDDYPFPSEMPVYTEITTTISDETTTNSNENTTTPVETTTNVQPSGDVKAYIEGNFSEIHVTPGDSFDMKIVVENIDMADYDCQVAIADNCTGYGVKTSNESDGVFITVTADKFVTGDTVESTARDENGDTVNVLLSTAPMSIVVTDKRDNAVLLDSNVTIIADYSIADEKSAVEAKYCKSYFDVNNGGDCYLLYWAFTDKAGTYAYAMPTEGNFTITADGETLYAVSSVLNRDYFSTFNWGNKTLYCCGVQIPKESVKPTKDGKATIQCTIRTPWKNFSFSYNISGLATE